jgi:mRNA-degrading endonuclease YafQ of YafQ-DinJ toxin-antitoxin module
VYNLLFPESYTKKEIDFLKKHPELIERHKKVLKLLELDINYPSLRLHKLSGNLKDYYSVSINLTYRIIFKLIDRNILLVDVNTHDSIYL